MKATYQQNALWDDIPAIAYKATPIRREHAPRCYLCGDEAEGKCEHCGRKICYPCGAGWGMVRCESYECQYGDLCDHALYVQWHRHCNLMRGLLAQDYDYPRENLEEFLARHDHLWHWATSTHKQQERLYTHDWNHELRRDFGTALNRCRKFLEKPMKKGA